MNAEDSQQFLSALHHFIERMQWFTTGRSVEDGLETDKVRMLLAEWDEHLEPWRGRIDDEQMEAHFESLQPLIKTSRGRVRLMFLVTLHKAVEARFKWLISERALQMPGKIQSGLAQSKPDDRERFLEKAREILGHEFDAKGMFQEAMDLADESESGWKCMRDDLHREWAEFFTADMQARLAECDVHDAVTWMLQLLADMFVIKSEHPELAV